MGNLLFSPSGRIGPSEFVKGALIIGIISAVIALIGLINFSLYSILNLVSILLLFPIFCLLIKRSHDAGKSGWMSILWLILWGVILIVLSMILQMIFPSPSTDALEVAAKEMTEGGGNIMAMLEMTKEYAPAIARESAIPSAIASVAGSFIAAYVINMILKRDGDNEYGPA